MNNCVRKGNGMRLSASLSASMSAPLKLPANWSRVLRFQGSKLKPEELFEVVFESLIYFVVHLVVVFINSSSLSLNSLKLFSNRRQKHDD